MISENKDEKDLALFGHWQTEEYQPPVAINGKVSMLEWERILLAR